ncbi:MAG TPA: ABC transporter substrate-binding protein [Acidimicrobiia bacterium]
MRILSLLPAATEIVYALGLEDDLIGVTHECDEPADARTKRVVVHSALAPDLSPAEIDREVRERSARGEPLSLLDTDYLRDVPPDVILTQDLCQVCAVPAGDVDAALGKLGCRADVVSLDPHSIDDIFATIVEVGRRAGVAERADAIVGRLRERVAAVERTVARRPRVPTLALEWVDPPFVAGHWLPEMVELAGGRVLLGEPGTHSRQIDWAEAGAVRPTAVMVAPCGFGLDAAREQATGVPELSGALVIAVDAAGYYVRPGPRVVDGIEALAAALHPSAGLPAREAVATRVERD